MKNPVIAIIGRPNVGKSSLFNRIIHNKKAIVHDVAGTTRDALFEPAYFGNKHFTLVDTAGFLKQKDVLSQAALSKVKESIGNADLLIYVVDGNIPPTLSDTQIADMARKTGKPIYVVANKIDHGGKGNAVGEYKAMGFGKVFEVSSIHDRGVNEFLTELTKDIEDTEPETEASKGLKIAITGRPNVGKSSLLNAFAKKERAIVSDIPGTTRDVVTEVLDGQDIIIRMADTAGTRRPGKIGKAYKKGEPVEKYSNLRTKKEIEDSDVVLIVIDAKEGATTQDLHIAGDAKELGKGIILVINKWDLNEKRTQEQYLSILRRRFSFMIWVPAVFVSAKTGRNIDQIVEQAKLISENQNRQINTSRLNRIIQDFVLDNPPRGAKKVKPKVYFVAQTGVLPPTFTITVKHHDAVHFSWKRAVENELRRHFDFTGTPIRVELKPKNEKRY